jgi:hypothetical protein
MSDNFKISGHRHSTTHTHSHSKGADPTRKELSGALLAGSACSDISEKVADNLMRPLTNKESGVKPLRGRVARGPDGGGPYLVMRKTLQNKSLATLLPRLSGTGTSPTKEPRH